MEMIFAPYGNSRKFYEKSNNSFQAAKYVFSMGLNGYEYLCTQGIHISDDGCETLKNEFEKYNISLSIRAYDFLRLSCENEEKKKNIDLLCETVRVAEKCGSKRVIVPLDNCAVRTRKEVFENTVSSILNVIEIMHSEGIDDVFICPETMGLIQDLGTVDEIISICMKNEMIMPAVNVGNIYARNRGKAVSLEFYMNMIDKFYKRLGAFKANYFHLYYSKVEYSHHGFKSDIDFENCEDENQTPDNILRAVKIKNVHPFIVCKSPSQQDIDILFMKKYFESIKE